MKQFKTLLFALILLAPQPAHAGLRDWAYNAWITVKKWGQSALGLAKKDQLLELNVTAPQPHDYGFSQEEIDEDIRHSLPDQKQPKKIKPVETLTIETIQTTRTQPQKRQQSHTAPMHNDDELFQAQIQEAIRRSLEDQKQSKKTIEHTHPIQRRLICEQLRGNVVIKQPYVVPQKGLRCGYCSIRDSHNVRLRMQGKKPIDKDDWEENVFTPQNEFITQRRLQKRTPNPLRETIDGGEIERLLDRDPAYYGFTPGNRYAKYMTIDDFENTIETGLLSLQDAQSTIEQGGIFTFFLGNMSQQGDYQGTEGHWTSVTVTKEKGRYIFVATDSLNSIMCNDRRIKTLIKKLVP